MTYDRALHKMRACIKANNYRMTDHATEEAWDDDISLIEIERTILEGQIVERQRDRVTHESKFIVRSDDTAKQPLELVVKFGPVGELYIITVYQV
jgi:hypothetical protein